MEGLTFDTGALIALERRQPRMSKVVARAWEARVRITVPTAVVAEWWRSPNAVATRLLAAVDIEPLDEALALRVGEALGAVAGASVVDTIVMASAARRGDIVYTSDIGDLQKLQVRFPSVRLLRV
ncbi:MAG: PIN domain-containing protein [Myxococcota bacterium]